MQYFPQTPRRKRRERAEAHVERGAKKRKTVTQIRISTQTVERIVGGKYQWRTSAYEDEQGNAQRKRPRLRWKLVYDDGG